MLRTIQYSLARKQYGDLFELFAHCSVDDKMTESAAMPGHRSTKKKGSARSEPLQMTKTKTSKYFKGLDINQEAGD